ncbi:MAG TPA: HAD family hydrolase [Streptosporangiaceae bacterium]
MINAVVFDVGETLVDETRQHGEWADWLGVPRHTFSAVFGGMVATGREFRDALVLFKPDFHLPTERRRRAEAGLIDEFTEADLYPDTRACLTALRDQGVWVGIAGNQPARAGDLLQAMDLPVDLIATSQGWGVSKPDPCFFERVVAAVPFPAGEIAYVGDRVDNDMKPAKAAGLHTIYLRRGPWGYLWAGHPDLAGAADWQVASLAEIPPLLAAANRG